MSKRVVEPVFVRAGRRPQRSLCSPYTCTEGRGKTSREHPPQWLQHSSLPMDHIQHGPDYPDNNLLQCLDQGQNLKFGRQALDHFTSISSLSYPTELNKISKKKRPFSFLSNPPKSGPQFHQKKVFSLTRKPVLYSRREDTFGKKHDLTIPLCRGWVGDPEQGHFK